MKYKKIKLTTVLLLGLGITGLQAQEAISSSGGGASGSGGSMSYTLGQVAYTSSTGTGGSISQGVQQGYIISLETAIEEANEIQLELLAYPNPTSDFLILQIAASSLTDIQTLGYQLFDINGKLLESKTLTGSETSIDMSNFKPATYIIKVMKAENYKDQGSCISSFKIIKN